MNQLVSVVIPTFNRPVYLNRAIKSVLEQTYKPIEIIVVDDNNPEDIARKETETIMESFTSYPNIIYIRHNRNKNGSAARNTGLKNAKGKYITFLDDDDEIAPRKIQKQVELLERLDETWGACYTAYHTLRANGLVERSCESRSGDCYIYALMKTLFLGSGSNLLLRKNVVDQINGYDESFCRSQDLEFLVRVSEIKKIAYIPEDLLTVHWEDGRKKNYVEMKKYCDFYKNAFQERIAQLNDYDRERVNTVLILDQCKIALIYRKYGEAIRLIILNHIKVKYIVKYVKYIIQRLLTHKSFGFYI